MKQASKLGFGDKIYYITKNKAKDAYPTLSKGLNPIYYALDSIEVESLRYEKDSDGSCKCVHVNEHAGEGIVIPEYPKSTGVDGYFTDKNTAQKIVDDENCDLVEIVESLENEVREYKKMLEEIINVTA